MQTPANAMEWQFKASTDIWTGDAQGKSARLIPTGLLGSIRWWFEVLVRGLGGETCDPTEPNVHCPDTNKEPDKPGHHCVVCELFGCTGWARKFRLMVVDDKGNVIQGQIKAGQIFTLCFIPLRPISEKEWCLLDLTLRLIADYGAIGGKTAFKPSDEWGIADLGREDLQEQNGQVMVQSSRRGLPLQRGDLLLEVSGTPVRSLNDLQQKVSSLPHGMPVTVKIERNGQQQELPVWTGKQHHQDFGLISIEGRPKLQRCARQQLEDYVKQEKWRKDIADNEFSWASLQNFWCVKGRYLARKNPNTSSYNYVIDRPEPKSQSFQGDSWIAGRRPNRAQSIPPESKKVFSFKDPEEARRTFGFVESEEGFAQVREKLEGLKSGADSRKSDPRWRDFSFENEFRTKDRILSELLQEEAGT